MKPKSNLSSNFTLEQSTKLANKVPEFLRITPELKQEIQEQQDKLREKFAKRFAKPSHDEVALHLAIAYEQASREFFAHLAQGFPATEEEISFNRRRLAQALQEQGRHEEAIDVLDVDVELESQLHREIVQEFHAIIIPDDEFCSCSTSNEIPSTHITKTVRTPDGIKPLVSCSVCGHKNATSQTPESLQAVNKLRNHPKRIPDTELKKLQ